MSFQASHSLDQSHNLSLRPACRLCGRTLKHTVVDLGMSPPCESFRQESELGLMEAYYPLHVRVCEECMLVQLEEYVSPESIFEEYAYFSSYSTSWVAHAQRYCEKMIERFGLDARSFVVELASNDGYLLQHFVARGIPVLGIEPAINVAEVAISRNIPTKIAFFGKRLAGDMAAVGQKADLIVANNVLAQVPDINDFLSGMKRILKPQGVVTLEFPHVATLIAQNQFDTIYHEHFSYFSLFTVQVAARIHSMEIFDVEELPTHGGSLRVYLGHAGRSGVISANVAALLQREQQAGLHGVEAYTSFAERARQAKRNLLYFLISVKERGASICGYGAPGKGNTLLNYCGIGTDFLDFTVDRNPYKHGRFTPGMHIPILPVEAIDRHRPDYILILPWNLKAEIVDQMRHVGQWGAKFVVPIPEVAVIDPLEDLS
ncbi:class I SAM-dependent methyltransferase (plasmid) [Shinella sp. H4-D48]|uniref:class I SAM-dependent methyltransferase n=1 Tax=Shinella sp. H4-D48 TaxID=2925841 RepID=UPI001F531C17|nr:class I SAM-dependent methyltransferase [Shinella sp. H4-D48]UNK40458.1 class I SAM-dependent methyltransferase [Shinella sp. H4-D48]